MTLIAGIDGCPAGWICLVENLDTGEIYSSLYRTARELVYQSPSPDLMMIDIPIGLPEAGHRQCDVEARRLLANRHMTIFPAPIRAALTARTREEASDITFGIDGRRVAHQSWGLYPKVREIDELLRSDVGLRGKLLETHPELCFRQWNNGEILQSSKKSPTGRQARFGLIGEHLFNGIRHRHPKATEVGSDDIADAFAALWTAKRKWYGTAIQIPSLPPQDSFGITMSIWY